MGTYKLLTWNIGFAGGIHGLEGCLGTKSDVMARLSGMAEVLSKAAADVVCLQEIDRRSKRSFYVDQVDYLATQSGYPYQAFVQTWRSWWIPYPITWRLDRQFGPMDAGQVILSKYPISWHAHITHEKPPSRRGLFRYFYLDRVSQLVQIAVPGGDVLRIGHVHFEAFDGVARMQQAKTLLDRLANGVGGHFSLEGKTLSPLVLCGDFNAIPQGATRPTVFPDDPNLSYAHDNTLNLFLERGFVSAGSDATCQDYPAYAPNRQLTHVFYEQGLSDVVYRVLPTGCLSDHWPGMLQYVIR